MVVVAVVAGRQGGGAVVACRRRLPAVVWSAAVRVTARAFHARRDGHHACPDDGWSNTFCTVCSKALRAALSVAKGSAWGIEAVRSMVSTLLGRRDS
jgi:hypothetical protein